MVTNIQTIAKKALDPLSGHEMPMSQEAENNLIASILIDPECLTEIHSLLKDENDFFILSNRIVYAALMRLKSKNEPIDGLTIVEELQSAGDFEQIGGYTKIMAYTNGMIGTSVHAPVYAEIVARMAQRRRMIEASDTMRRLSFDLSMPLDEIKSKADNVWIGATSDSRRNKGEWIGDVMSRVYDEIEAAMVSKKAFSGLPSGLHDVDMLINGFGKGQFIVIAARPAMGKSAAMDNIALHLARDCGITVLYATSERSPDEVVKRMAAIESGINGMKIESGRMNSQEASLFTKAVGRISQYSIKFMDEPQPRPRDIYAEADWLIKRHNCQIVLFDGMYRAKTGDSQVDREDTKKYGAIALELKTMARELNIPVVTTHQLNRNVESRADKHPMMSDLRESGRIEEEADKIIFLYRDEVYNPNTEFPNECKWIVSKHRNGQTGIVSTYYEKTNTRFSSAIIHNYNTEDD